MSTEEDSKQIMQCDQIKKRDVFFWKGIFYSLQNKNEIFPLSTEPTDIITCNSIKAAMCFAQSPTEPWGKNLKIVHWFTICVQRILAYYRRMVKSEHKCRYAAIKVTDTDTEEKSFVESWNPDFCGIVFDDLTDMFSMVVFYNPNKKKFEGLVPYNKELFTSLVYYHLYGYFTVNYDFLKGKPLNHDLLSEAERKARLSYKSWPEAKAEIYKVLFCSDGVKRNMCLAFLGKCKDFRQKASKLEDNEENN